MGRERVEWCVEHQVPEAYDGRTDRQQQKRSGLVAGDSKGCKDSLIQGTLRPRPLMRMKIEVVFIASTSIQLRRVGGG